MENSILISTKKILGIDANYTVFDLDIITHINAAFGILYQLGIGQDAGFMIEDDIADWDEFVIPDRQLNLVKTYIYLKVRMLFDPPTTSYLIEAQNKQVQELEWRLNTFREFAAYPIAIEVLNE